MGKTQLMKVWGGALLVALLFGGATKAWAQIAPPETTLPAPPTMAANAPVNPPPPGNPPPPAGPLAPGGPFGPGVSPERGPQPGGPEAMANTQVGAAREINHAYRAIAEATGAISTTATIDEVARQMVTHGKALYAQAYTSYNDEGWFAANETAKAAISAAEVANHLAKSVNSLPLTVPDLQAPPVITASVTVTGTAPALNEPLMRAGDELTHGYNAILTAKVTALANPDLTDADFYLTSSETLYKAAYAAYTDKAYNQSIELAHAAHSAADVILHLGNAATGVPTPGVPPTPPAPNF